MSLFRLFGVGGAMHDSNIAMNCDLPRGVLSCSFPTLFPLSQPTTTYQLISTKTIPNALLQEKTKNMYWFKVLSRKLENYSSRCNRIYSFDLKKMKRKKYNCRRLLV